MSTFSVNTSDYSHALVILVNWLHNSSSLGCRGQQLSYMLQDIIDDQPGLSITDTRPFGNILSNIEGEDLMVLMKVLLAHIKNPNFILRNGSFKGKTFLQGAIATGNKDLVKMLLSNTHGSKINGLIEPLIIDYDSAKWMKKEAVRNNLTTI